jgi:hypothetical protein
VTIGINYPDDRAVGRSVFSFERETGFLASTPKHQLTNTCTYRINSDQWLAGRLKILIESLHNQQLAALK